MTDPLDRTHAASRRAVLKAGATAALLAMSSTGHAAGVAGARPRVAAGYWQASGRLEGIGSIAAAWLGKCGGDIGCTKNGFDEAMVDALSLPSSPGPYHVRVLGGTGLAPLRAVRVDARYGSATHGIWSAWTRARAMHAASPVRARWTSPRGELLALDVTVAGKTETVVLPAQRGLFALVFDDGRGLPKWSALAMRAPDPAQPWRVELVRRDAVGGAVPHVLIALDAAVALQRA